ncbi:alpha/beta hydrolase [Pannus brasiliensis CCIBt3594]|uniref:Alpha/beta hydrolase n=1 Tax=Pannus brasiliensis CCIBt3594 TaxID=1427578 RepID=A0AAW9QQF7_9CHRO
MFSRKTFTSPTARLSYLEWNEGQKPLLLLHGMADHALVWSSLGDYLQKDYHIIAPDLRGHGESDKPKTGYKFRDYIEDLEALMDFLGWEKASILGHSWSAKLAAIWAGENPRRFDRMILVDPFFIGKMPSLIRLTFPILYEVLPFLKITRSFSSYEEIENTARQLKQYRGWSEFQEKVFKESIEQKNDGTWSGKFYRDAREEIFEDVMAVAGFTGSIDIPTLLITPEKGLNRTEWQIKPYKTYVKNLQIQTVPGNHWPFLVEPGAFDRAIEEFLKAG